MGVNITNQLQLSIQNIINGFVHTKYSGGYTQYSTLKEGM